jgi:hypothetical protein
MRSERSKLQNIITFADFLMTETAPCLELPLDDYNIFAS